MSDVSEPVPPDAIVIFNEQFRDIKKLIPFNKKWRTAFNLRGAIHHPENRLVLQPGEMVKCHDDLNRPVIFMGSKFGLLVLYIHCMSRKRYVVMYEVAEMFCEQSIFPNSSGTLSVVRLEYLFSPLFQQMLGESSPIEKDPISQLIELISD